MLEKSMYDSWASRIHLFIKGKKNDRMMLDLIDNGPLVYPTVEENGQTRPKKYYELTKAQQLQDDCDVQATNIILHGLPPDVKFATNVKLAKSLYTTNYDQLYAYLNQHERHVNEALQLTLQYQVEFLQLDSSLAVPTFQQGDDLIECINKAMAFLSVVASRFPPSNNQLRTSSNPINQATIQDGRVTVQQVQGRQTQSFVGTKNQGIATTSRENYATSQAKIVMCYNCLGEGHMAKQCTQPKRIAEVQVAQQTIPHNSAFQTEDLDAYDSDCDDISSAKAVLMANLSRCNPDVLSKVPYTDSYPNDIINQDVQEM
ncbi:retrovirus-related pol polyprotein from transposon TNT 1-94 [Tanacetum coccineum]